ncbi:MAG: hypothetical protein IJY72_02735, partial [Akkermansia sp.]|nr:hypothetical protein [Akkermansia sp.]
APLRALATLGTLHLRYKIAQKMDRPPALHYAINICAHPDKKQEEIACSCQREGSSLLCKQKIIVFYYLK